MRAARPRASRQEKVVVLSPTVTILRTPIGALAEPVDRRSRQLLERAGFVCATSIGLHRLRRDTSASIAVRQIRDATHHLTRGGYSVTYVLGQLDQQHSRHPSGWLAFGPPRTVERHSFDPEDMSADVINGHLLVLARHYSGFNDLAMLAVYPATGRAITLSNQDGSDDLLAVHFSDLASAQEHFGHPITVIPKPASRRAAAQSTTARDNHVPASASASAVQSPPLSPLGGTCFPRRP